MVKILGISAFYHDAAAALVIDGQPVALAEEERFSRKKHDCSFPVNAIDFVLKKGDIKPEELDHVVFYEKPFLKFERGLLSSLSFFPKGYKVFRESMLGWLKEKLWIKALISERLGVERDRILFVPHHVSHAASAFLCSPFEEAGILTLDGVGEWATTTLGAGKDNQIEVFKQINFPHSLGLLYSAFTAYLGFKVNRGEYKVMGMSAYGKPEYTDEVYKIIDVKDDGSYRLDLDYFSYHTSVDRAFNSKFTGLFGRPRSPEMKGGFDQRHADIAASIQHVTEEAAMKLAGKVYQETGHKKLCIAGGVAQNGIANYKIIKNTPIEEIYVQPSPGDGGGALGAALYVHYTLLDNQRKYTMEHAFYGADYTEDEIRDFLETNGIEYEQYSDNELFDRVAGEIKSGKVIGFYQGRFEWGPRGLGNRSILADPCNPNIKDRVNKLIKFREGFRPFAPSVLAEHTGEYFELDAAHYPSRFMQYVCPVKEDKASTLPAVTHVDGSSRPQAVFKEDNPRFHALIEKFHELTGTPVVLNTSYNLRGEPMVNTPQEAYNSFTKSQMDVCVLERFVIENNGG